MGTMVILRIEMVVVALVLAVVLLSSPQTVVGCLG
jgi:archaellin